MNTRLTHTQRAAYIERALSNGYTKVAIADVIGMTRGNLGGLLKKAPKKSKYIGLLDDWLIDNFPPPGSDSEADVLIARDLANLADIMKSPEYSDDFKARKFAAWVKVAYDSLPDLVKTIKKNTDW